MYIIPTDMKERLDVMINQAWNLFCNQFINKKYDILLEAPFQLHFASILKQLGELYCLRRHEYFIENLEVNLGVTKKNMVDITLSFFDRDQRQEIMVPIELKFKTVHQSAEDIGVMEIYKDVYTLEQVLKDYKRENLIIPFGYFFCITNNHRYINPASKGLKTVFCTHEAAEIKKDFEYKYLGTKAGTDFFNKYGTLKFRNKYSFIWDSYVNPVGEASWFLKLKIKD